ncbi:Cullin family-domain-containing protein [Protomyces lactucae-debilis]|uniref:Cullin family-domain-containing protein n=1 Tax=Protomyces lactucae-debilis TaxID=2754530 RepID=A0A1Y2EUE5_PROLT|nr:Cullin family-domain-containing protein [Protomyces lactucae-debilis]ORY75137.1 Cullin family-domain-containing protein [Protomyces lactucae-debilis]
MLTDKPMQVDTAKTPIVQPQSGDKAPVKKLTIKNLQISGSQSKDDAVYDATFLKLESALGRLLQGEEITGLQDLYHGCELLVRGGRSTQCEELVRKQLTRKAQALQREILPRCQSQNAMDVCTLMVDTWHTWCRQANLVRCIFWYLDRRCMLGVEAIDDLATRLFREHVLDEAVLGNFSAALNALFDEDRHAGIRRGPRHTIELASVKMLRDTGRLSAGFDSHVHHLRPYLEQFSAKVYEMDAGAYLRNVDGLEKSERNRAEDYWSSEYTRPVSMLVREIMVYNVEAQLLKGVEGLFRARDLDGFKLAYEYISESDERPRGRPALLQNWATLIKQDGVRLMESDNLVETLLDFKRDMDEICLKSFGGDEQAVKLLREQFNVFVNSKGDRPAELIAKYVDSVLRQGNKKFDEQTLEVRMDQLLDLIRFIASKDVFEAFYKKDLAKRLLLNKSASNDAEASLLNKLKIECGAQFTQNLENMFKDIDLSRDFNRKLQNKQLDVMVISQGSWPTYADVKCKLPDAMQQELDAFGAIYGKAQAGRKLMWRHTLGHLQVKARFDAGERELQVSMFQGLVLLLFNTSKTLTVEAIGEATGLEQGELHRTLQSLACGRPETRVLLKAPKGKEVNAGDKFMVNDGFKSAKRIVKINQIQMKETKEENQATMDRVDQDRSFEIQAATVRIMKAAKRKTHADLISSVIDTIKGRGTPKVGDIKKAIEKLIEREFLSRQDKEYVYEA